MSGLMLLMYAATPVTAPPPPMDTKTACIRTFRAYIHTVELMHDFHTNRALPRNHIRIIIWMNESQLALFFQHKGFVQCIRIRAAMQHNLDILATKTFNRFDFNCGVVSGTTFALPHLRFGRRICDTLRVIACRAVITLLSCSAVSCAILLYAPRILYENTAWVSSRFRYTWLWMRREIWGANSKQFPRVTSYTREVRIFSGNWCRA